MSEPGPPAARGVRPLAARVAFALFVIAVALATHWPGVRIAGEFARPDLLVHVAVFGLWALLLIVCAFFGPALSIRNIAVSAAIALAYAGIDEATQGIPALRRTVALSDFLAGAAGIGGAAGAALLARLSWRRSGGLRGPPVWVISLAAGVVAGGLATLVLRPISPEPHGATPIIPLVLCAPFVVLLASIALMPFISARFWHNHFADFALLLGGITTGYYLFGYTHGQPGGMTYGVREMAHVLEEYVAFIALVGGLFVASGGVVVEVRGRGRPMANVVMLAFGAVIANVVGTTGASMLLIRPFMRLNEGRLRAIHIVMFIFIVSNCGGALTPIGDPPLYLGYLKGVPFFWTLRELWPMWLVCVVTLLATFFAVDTAIERRGVRGGPEPGRGYRVSVRGASGLIALALIIGAVFIDPVLARRGIGTHGVPVGALVQIVVAAAAYFAAPRENLESNGFSFFPVQEVGLLFAGIFATMVPALGYLAANGASFGIDSPTEFYFATGSLSAVLDNAPTYANFLQVAFGGGEMNADGLRGFAASDAGGALLRAVSLGAVFFGAFTYIGNGPNFMVKAIAERHGVRMPSFFGYLTLALLFLSPAIVLVWAIFIR